jgi:hypothetical protein
MLLPRTTEVLLKEKVQFVQFFCGEGVFQAHKKTKWQDQHDWRSISTGFFTDVKIWQLIMRPKRGDLKR